MTQARAFFENDRKFNNLSLYEQRITRNIHKNMKLLRELQVQRKTEDLIKAKAKPLTKAASAASEENGFGFSPEERSGLIATIAKSQPECPGQVTPVVEATGALAGDSRPKIPGHDLKEAA
jgi:hypothetical protein